MRFAVVALLFEAATAFIVASPLGVSIDQRQSVLLQPRRSDGCTGAAEAVNAAGDGPLMLRVLWASLQWRRRRWWLPADAVAHSL